MCRICRVSQRQLQWWDERKVVSPRHEGHNRVYTTEEVVGHSQLLSRRAAFAKEGPLPQNGDDRFFALCGYDRQLDLSFLDINTEFRWSDLPIPSEEQGSIPLPAAAPSASRVMTGGQYSRDIHPLLGSSPWLSPPSQSEP